MKRIMYAKKEFHKETNEFFFNSIHNSLFGTKSYPEGIDNKIYKIEVSMHPDQTPETKTTGFGLDYWGWIEKGSDKFEMVYPSYIQFIMCFAYGLKAEEKAGKGKGYRLNVKEIGAVKE